MGIRILALKAKMGIRILALEAKVGIRILDLKVASQNSFTVGVKYFEETQFTPLETAATQALRSIEDFDLEVSKFKDLVASGKIPLGQVLRRDAVHTAGDGGYASAQVHRRF